MNSDTEQKLNELILTELNKYSHRIRNANRKTLGFYFRKVSSCIATKILENTEVTFEKE